jgi:hypothetical protein
MAGSPMALLFSSACPYLVWMAFILGLKITAIYHASGQIKDNAI